MKDATPLSIKRHYRNLSEEKTNDLVGALAELIVACVKKHGTRPLCRDKTKDKQFAPNTTKRVDRKTRKATHTQNMASRMALEN